MRRRSLAILVVVAGAMAVTAAAALAVSAARTTFKASAGVTPKKSGTPKRPRPERFKLVLRGGTTAPGTPSPTTRVKVSVPKALGFYGKRWTSRKRCSKSTAVAKGDGTCPKSSRLGGGKMTLASQAVPGGPVVTEAVALRAYVLKNGNLGVFADAGSVHDMLEGKVKGRSLTLGFSKAFREIQGVPAGITKLSLTLSGTTKRKGKRYAFVSSTACHPNSKDKTWTIVVTNKYVDGSNKDTTKPPCVKPQ